MSSVYRAGPQSQAGGAHVRHDGHAGEQNVSHIHDQKTLCS